MFYVIVHAKVGPEIQNMWRYSVSKRSLSCRTQNHGNLIRVGSSLAVERVFIRDYVGCLTK